MGFDDEVDAARKRFEAEIQEDETETFDALGALKALLPKIEGKIKSRRLTFSLSEDDEDDTSILVVHSPSEEELGYVFAEDGEYIFESSLADYFDDFVDEDADRFVDRLYETLRADLPKYEVETERDDD
jgi:hypothetical protein